MDQARDIIRRFEALEGRRSEWEGDWRMCADYVLPRMGEECRRKASRVFDSTASLALGRFAAAMEGMLTPRSQKWHSLITGEPEIDREPETARWLESFRDLMFSLRYAPEANFGNQLMEVYLSLGVFGTGILFIGAELGRGMHYKCVPVHECFIAANAKARIDTVFRAYQLTARQAVSEFGDELPDGIKRDADDPARMDQCHDFIHAVFPRQDQGGGPAAKAMPIASYHLARAARKIVRESGYRTMPYAVARFYVAPGGVYGRSPAMDVMPDILQINAIQKTVIRAAEKMVYPPLLVADDDILMGFNLKAGSLNPGGLDDQGRPRVVPLQLGGNLPVGLEMANQCREVINEAYFLTLFQVLMEKTGRQTATEVVERAKERAQLLAPTMGRLQDELLRTVIEREIDIIVAAGGLRLLGEIPDGLARMGGHIQPQYATEMYQALSAIDGQATLRSLEGLGMVAQFDPEAVDYLDSAGAARVIFQSFGVPAKVQRSDREVAKIRRQRQEKAAQAQQAAMMSQGLQEAGEAAQAAKTGAEAARIMEGRNA